ncbi:MAG: hypothetical protein ACR2FO_04930 [Actinomycetota bacterium]
MEDAVNVDDLDALIDERTRANPEFPELVKAAAKKRNQTSKVAGDEPVHKTTSLTPEDR